QPEEYEHARPHSKEIRTVASQLGSVLFSGVGRSDIKICFAWLLPRLPETDLREMPQVPRQRPRVRRDHGYTGTSNPIPLCQLGDLRRKSKDVFRRVSICVRIRFIGGVKEDTLACVVRD